jgi:selenide,water dikinase
MKRLVLVGGGHSHVEVLRQFGAAPLPGVELVLVSPDRFTPYSGMLPGLVAGHYRFKEAHLDLETLARFARARFERQLATGLDPRARHVVLASGRRIEFDVAAVDIGSVAATAGIPGAANFALPVKPIDAFLAAWQTVIERVSAGSLRQIIVVGGGAAGVEMLLAMQHRLKTATGSEDAVQFRLVTDVDRTVPNHPPKTDAIVQRLLAERRVELHLSSRIARVEQGAILTAEGTRIEGDVIVWATGGAAPPTLRGTGLPLDAAGFLAVNEYLHSVSSPAVFATGDCATMVHHPRPRSGVFAVRQAAPLVVNLRATLTNRPLRRYVPQKHALALISAGNRYAIATRAGWALAGGWVWRWKDWIDRRFMQRYATHSLEK